MEDLIMAPAAFRRACAQLTLVPGVLSICLAACGGGDPGNQARGSAPAEPATTAPPAALSEPGHGHFLGEITVGDEKYYSEALLTIDGEVRIYVGSPVDSSLYSGATPSEASLHPQESMLFIGTIDEIGTTPILGTGAVIGQICDGASMRFCDEPAPAKVSLEASLEISSGYRQKRLAGALAVMTPDGEERWSIDLWSHSSYYELGTGVPGNYRGIFQERLAPFAQSEEMPLVIEPDGQIRFASTASGCAGEGTLLPHLDGRYDVYDVHLRITDCNAQFAYLNSEFEGLATETQGGAWDYDVWLVIFLSAPEGPPPRPAFNMRAYLVDPAYGDMVPGDWD